MVNGSDGEHKIRGHSGPKYPYPKHVAEQKCSNCTLYQSKSADSGGCAIFPGKQVAANGWCSAYQKKA
ncbi:MAG: hypothetical protein EBR85_00515 [Betaproteobacteria bacterium]|nr:hypothetical protein [Betaproteobacteria bacterium]